MHADEPPRRGNEPVLLHDGQLLHGSEAHYLTQARVGRYGSLELNLVHNLTRSAVTHLEEDAPLRRGRVPKARGDCAAEGRDTRHGFGDG